MTAPLAGAAGSDSRFGATGLPLHAPGTTPVEAPLIDTLGKSPDIRPRIPRLPQARSGRISHIAVVPDVDGPRVRLGLAWAFIVFVLAAAGSLWLGAWMALAGGIAAAQAARTWRSKPRRPDHAIAAAGGALLPLAAIAGPVVAVGALAAFGVASVAGGFVRAASGKATRGRLSSGLTFMVGAAVGAAAAAPVLASHLGLVEVLVLLAVVGAFDASNYLIGSGASNPWEGPAAGMAFIAVITLAVAAIFVPPFRGASPWILGLIALVLTPAGPVAATSLLGHNEARAPALRRLDSLLLTGPVWVAAAMLTLS